jgi:hypothetical protein
MARASPGPWLVKLATTGPVRRLLRCDGRVDAWRMTMTPAGDVAEPRATANRYCDCILLLVAVCSCLACTPARASAVFLRLVQKRRVSTNIERARLSLVAITGWSGADRIQSASQSSKTQRRGLHVTLKFKGCPARLSHLATA